MSFLGKIMDTMRLNDDEDDDYFLDDDYEDEKPARKNLFKKQTADDFDDYEEEKPRFLPAPPTAIRLFRCAAEAEWKFP